MRQPASIGIALAFVALSTFIPAAGCSPMPKADTSQLSAQDLRTLQAVQIVRGVNDVTTAAIATNRAGQLSDEYTAIILRINKQVLDVIEANPANYRDAAIAALKNARDGLPVDVALSIGPYLDAARAVFDGLPARIPVKSTNVPASEKG